MKSLLLLFSLLLNFSFSEVEDWESADGRVAQLDLLSIEEKDGLLTGTFKTNSGKKMSLSINKLSSSSQEKLEKVYESQRDVLQEEVNEPSVFLDQLEGNLVALEGRSLEKLAEFKEPSRYYLFYYTASWCGPCQSFTPELVKFYKRQKRKHGDAFEVIVVTSDRSEEDMDGYAKSKKMTFPHISLKAVDGFKKEFRHPGNGIPNIVMTDLQGKILKTSYENDKYVGPSSVLSHLESIL